jgi:2,2-dialkylglycine decarboxylase (pyruvate)
MVDATSVGHVVAMIVEPIKIAGGIVVAPGGYLKRLREKCDQGGILLIFDESQTGLGRTGRMFGFEHSGVIPDIITLSKTLGGGLPVSAVIASDTIAAAAKENGFSHYTSHASDPLMATVGLAVVNVILDQALAERAERVGQSLAGKLRELQSRHDAIGDIRGHGLLLGVEIVADRDTRAPGNGLIAALSKRCFDLGLNLNRVGGPHAVWRIAPPLAISPVEIDQATAILATALANVS